MAGVRFTDVQARPTACLDLTSVTLDEFQQLVPPLRLRSNTLPQVKILMPTKKPRGQELTWEQHVANQALHQRRLRIEHVNRSVKPCRLVKDRIRLWKEGVRQI